MCNHERTVQYYDADTGRFIEKCRDCREEVDLAVHERNNTLETDSCPHNHVQITERADWIGEPGYGGYVDVEVVECLECGGSVYDELYPETEEEKAQRLLYTEEIPF